jgi:hypothetical protein
METMFLMISGSILLAGVFYWFWSLIQLTQTKILLIENAVFELRGLIRQSLQSDVNQVKEKEKEKENDSQVEVEVEKVENQESENQVEDNQDQDQENENEDEYEWPLKQEKQEKQENQDQNNELRPGGVPMEVDLEEKTVDIRSFLTVTEIEQPKQNQNQNQNQLPPLLESMPVKELRRLAEQRGIPGVSEMRKKELMSAIRQQVIKPVELSLTLSLAAEEAGTVAGAGAGAGAEAGAEAGAGIEAGIEDIEEVEHIE